MTEQRRYKSEAFEALHSACTGLHRNGIITDAEIQVYDQLYLMDLPSPDVINSSVETVEANRRLVHLRTIEVLGSSDKARRWLSARNRGLDAVPEALLGTVEGTARVLQVLARIEHGIVG